MTIDRGLMLTFLGLTAVLLVTVMVELVRDEVRSHNLEVCLQQNLVTACAKE